MGHEVCHTEHRLVTNTSLTSIGVHNTRMMTSNARTKIKLTKLFEQTNNASLSFSFSVSSARLTLFIQPTLYDLHNAYRWIPNTEIKLNEFARRKPHSKFERTDRTVFMLSSAAKIVSEQTITHFCPRLIVFNFFFLFIVI